MPGGIFSENLPHIVLCILNKGVVAAQEYGRQYVALFHWKKERENVRVDCRCAGICTEPSYRELWSGTVYMHMIRILSQYMTVDHIIMVLDESMNGNEGF